MPVSQLKCVKCFELLRGMKPCYYRSNKKWAILIAVNEQKRGQVGCRIHVGNAMTFSPIKAAFYLKGIENTY